jgi:hypothetical protein
MAKHRAVDEAIEALCGHRQQSVAATSSRVYLVGMTFRLFSDEQISLLNVSRSIEIHIQCGSGATLFDEIQ